MKLEKVVERLTADAPNMERSGAELAAHYLDPGRHPASAQWSRKHAHTQRRLCERFPGMGQRCQHNDNAPQRRTPTRSASK